MDQTWIDLIAADSLSQYWGEFEAEVMKAPGLWAPWMTVHEVLAKVRKGEYAVWIGGRGPNIDIWGLTEEVTYPHGKCIRVVWASGESGGKDFWHIWTTILDRMAELLGARYIEVCGRPGWQKIYQPYGYDLRCVVLLKDRGDAGTKAAEQRDPDEQDRVDSGTEGVNGTGNGAD